MTTRKYCCSIVIAAFLCRSAGKVLLVGFETGRLQVRECGLKYETVQTLLVGILDALGRPKESIRKLDIIRGGRNETLNFSVIDYSK